MHLTNESEALHDAVIQIYEFGFGQMINIDAIHIPLPGGQHSCRALALPDRAIFCFRNLARSVLNHPARFFDRERRIIRPG